MTEPTRLKETDLPAPALFAEQLPVLRGMLSTLETSSAAGQRYVMHKVVGCLDGQTSRLFRGLNPRNRGALMDLLMGLRHQSDRISPDVAAFVGGAESLLCLIAAVE